MMSLRRLLGFPRLSMRIYLLILALFLILAYIVTGSAHQFFTQLRSSVGSIGKRHLAVQSITPTP
jgi:hypothetical protein